MPRSIEAVPIRFGEGTSLNIATGIIQRTTAVRAYYSFANGRDWMDKLSAAYVVAIATRSADTLLMQQIQDRIVEDPPFTCARCREATIGQQVIRRTIFPRLAELREHANRLIHHLDSPEHRGISEVNVEGVFEYCYHLFQENAEVLLGTIPDTRFPARKCKLCRKTTG